MPHRLNGPEFAEWVVTHRLLILLGVLLLTIISCVVAAGVPLRNSLLEACMPSSQDYAEYQQLVSHLHGDSDDFVYIATVEGEYLFTPEKLNAIREAAREIESLPIVQRVICLTDIICTTSGRSYSAREVAARVVARKQLASGVVPDVSNGSAVPVCWPKNREEQRKVDLESLRLAMLGDDQIAGMLLSNDGQAQAMIVEMEPRVEHDLVAQFQLRRQLEQILATHGLGDDGRFFAGVAITQGWMVEEILQTLVVQFPVGMLILCLAVYAIYRRLTIVVLTLTVGLTSICWAACATGSFFGEMSVLTGITLLLIIVISTSDTVHLTSAYQMELASGLGRDDAIRKVISEVGGACILTSASTAIGFLSLMIVPLKAWRHIAFAAATGVASALLLALTIIPIAFSLLRPMPTGTALPKKHRSTKIIKQVVDGFVRRCAHISLTYPKTVVTFHVLLVAVAFYGAMRIQVEPDLPRRFPEKHHLRRSVAFFNQELSGTSSIEVFVRTDPDKLLAPQMLESIANFGRRAEQIPQVLRTNSMVDLFNMVDRVVDFQTSTGLPASATSASACLGLLAKFDEETVLRVVAEEAGITRITVLVRPTGFVEVSKIADGIDVLAAQALPADAQIETTGYYPIIGRGTRAVVNGQASGLAICFLGITLTVWCGLRSLQMSVLALIPNALPVILLAGLLGFTLGKVDSDILVIGAIGLGLGVDDTIHFFHRYNIEHARTQDNRQALERTFQYTGNAIVQTTLILGLGLVPFAFSNFLTIWMMGTYLIFTLATALLADMLLLPSLIMLWEPRAMKTVEEP